MEVPRWITAEEDCLFCGRFVPVTTVEIEEGRQALIVSYVCNNEKCNSVKALGYPNTFRVRYDSPGFVTQWEDGLKNGWRKPVKAEA